MEHCQACHFWPLLVNKNTFRPPLGHLISPSVVKNGVIATATSPTPRPGGLSHRPKKLAFPSYLMNIFQITEFSNLSVSESWLFVRMGSTVMVSKMQQLDNMASQVLKPTRNDDSLHSTYKSRKKVLLFLLDLQLGSEYTRDILAWLRSRELSAPDCRQKVFMVHSTMERIFSACLI